MGVISPPLPASTGRAAGGVVVVVVVVVVTASSPLPFSIVGTEGVVLLLAPAVALIVEVASEVAMDSVLREFNERNKRKD